MPADSSLSLKPLLIEEIFGIVKRLRDERNLTVLLVEHNGGTCTRHSRSRLCHGDGRIVLEGRAETLRENSDIREFYFGLNEVGAHK